MKIGIYSIHRAALCFPVCDLSESMKQIWDISMKQGSETDKLSLYEFYKGDTDRS